MDDIPNNRIANSHNPNQGPWKKVLVCCSAGLLRSPTAAWILSNPPYNCNTRACGCVADYALIVLDPVLVAWADEIVVADSEVYDVVNTMMDINGIKKTIYNLELPDNYDTRDQKLIDVINAGLVNLGFVGTKLRCTLCMKDTETYPCEHCGEPYRVVDKNLHHDHEWSRHTISTMVCKQCEKVIKNEDYFSPAQDGPDIRIK